MDTIFIENLTYTGIHGVYKQEHHIPQRFNVSIQMDVETAKSSHSDNVEETVDYKKIQEKIEEIIIGEHYNLIEKLAQLIADIILQDVRVEACEVTIKKLDAFSVGTPGVTLRRVRRHYLVHREILPLLQNLSQEIMEHDVCVLPLLSENVIEMMKKEALTSPFIEAEKVYGNNVEQNFSYFRDYPKTNILWHIAKELESLIKEASLLPITFTEVTAQKYEITKLGISPHKDESRFKNLIVVCTLTGEAEFSICESKDVNSARKVFKTKPGDVIFMRAPGFPGKDIRPIHTVTNISSPRLSVTLREEIV